MTRDRSQHQAPTHAHRRATHALDAGSDDSAKLWAVRDVDELVAATTALMRERAPGTRVERCRTPVCAPGTDGTTRRTLWITLPEHQALAIHLPAGNGRCAVVRALAELVKMRVAALAEAERLGRSERLQRALYAIADQASVAGTELTPMFEALHRIIGTLMYAENFYIALYDRDHAQVRFAYYVDTVDEELPLPADALPLTAIADGPTWHVLRGGRPLRGSMEAIGERLGQPLHWAGPAPKDWLGVPLLQDGEVAGCVVVQSYADAHHYDADDQSLLTFVAQHVQTALGRRLAHAELEHRVQARTRELSEANRVLQHEVEERQRGERLQAALFQIAELASTTDTIDGFYAAAHRVVGELLYARNFYIALLSGDGSELTFPYGADERHTDFAPRQLSAGQGMTEYVLRSGAPLLAEESDIARLHAQGLVKLPGQGAVCWLGVPLICDERTVGVLVVQSYSRTHHYTRHDQELLTFVSYHIANALARIRAKQSLQQTLAQLEARVEERTHQLAVANRDLRLEIDEREQIEARLEHAALHDALTDLPNRALFLQSLTRALARYRGDAERGFAVLFLDLDRFKVINDSEGHGVGDALLIEAGARIRACLKGEDTVARLGGDEFAALLDGVHTADGAQRIAGRIIDALNAPFRLDGRELFTSVSIGIALATPHYQTPAELLRDADSAMYRAKGEGRHRCVAFDDQLRHAAVAQLAVENDLRRGLTRGELVPYYQPIVELATGAIVGYEALMRWRHPQHGVLLPDAFLDVAEDAGLVDAADWQIYTQVCRDAAALAGDHARFVAINLPARHFANPQFAPRLFGLLDMYGVPAARLCIEVTEHTLLASNAAVKHTLDTCRRAGIRIFLDDFGTGYSSLSYLNQYPIRTLKIDRSFVAQLAEGADDRDDAVIRAILAMAATLSLQVIAEGVETEAQRAVLRGLGCRYAQGFLYAKAQPIDVWIGAAPAIRWLTPPDASDSKAL